MARKYPAPQPVAPTAGSRENGGWDYHAERVRQLPAPPPLPDVPDMRVLKCPTCGNLYVKYG